MHDPEMTFPALYLRNPAFRLYVNKPATGPGFTFDLLPFWEAVGRPKGRSPITFKRWFDGEFPSIDDGPYLWNGMILGDEDVAMFYLGDFLDDDIEATVLAEQARSMKVRPERYVMWNPCVPKAMISVTAVAHDEAVSIEEAKRIVLRDILASIDRSDPMVFETRIARIQRAIAPVSDAMVAADPCGCAYSPMP